MIYISTDFDRERSAAYTLLVRGGATQTTIAIIGDDQRLKVIAAGRPGAAGKEMTDLLALNFSAVKLAFHGGRYAFVPDEVFEAASVPQYLGHLPNDGLAETFVSAIAPLGIRMLHQCDRLAIGPFVERFPNLHIGSTMQALLHGVSGYAQRERTPVLAIDRHDASLLVCGFEGDRFVYGNDFEVVSDDDIRYYLYAVVDHLRWNEQRPRICLSGDVGLQDDIHQWAQEHGIAVDFAESGRLSGISIPEEIKPKEHQYLTLLGLHLCGS